MSKSPGLGEVAGDHFFGAGGHYDVRGRKAVRALKAEQEKDRRDRERSAGLSRLALAEVAATQRRGIRQILPNQDDVSLPWLFDQVVSELNVEDPSVYDATGASKEQNQIDVPIEDFLQENNEEINVKVPWWKKRKEKKLTATLSDIFDKKDSVQYQEEVYKHRFSVERIHDPDSKIYSDLDKAASMMELREAVIKQQKRISEHPKRDAEKRIKRNAYAVGSDERMYQYHYWGDRSINISAPTADVLNIVRDDIKEHVEERTERRDDLLQEVKALKADLVLAKHTKANIHERWEQRRIWYEKQLEITKKIVQVRESQRGILEEQRLQTRKEIFRNVQLEIQLYNDRARYLGEPQVHKFVRALFDRCCNTGTDCWGNRMQQQHGEYEKNRKSKSQHKDENENENENDNNNNNHKSNEYKGCCFHWCSKCWFKSCINKFDIETWLQEHINKTEVWTFKCLPCKCCCCCCRCNGYRSIPYEKPSYLQYENDPFVAYKRRLVELDSILQSKSMELDPSGGGGGEGKKKKKKKKQKKKDQNETGQAK